jgi:hypothetical protein
MNTKKLWVLAIAMMIFAAPAFAGEAVQMWKCEMDDEADEEMIEAHAKEWLAAAKKLDGGANMAAYVKFPVAVNATGEMDIMFVVTFPTFTEWGKFWDAYPGSDAADIEEDAIEMIVCPDSVVWESVKIE